MFLTLSHWFQRQFRSGRPSRLGGRSRGGFRPRLEALEQRCVPTTWNISSSADDVTMIGTLRWAVANAHDGDVIKILPEVWSGEARHVTLTQGELFLNHNVTIESVGPEAIIDGNFSSRVFEVARGASVELDNLFIVDGNAQAHNSHGNVSLDGDGGGILNEGSLTIDNCSVANNGYSRSEFKNHALKAGGGIYNYHGYLLAVGSTVDENFAGAGGGIYNDRGTLVMTDTTMASNSASGGGGAICSAFGNMEIDHSTLVSNDAKTGGAVASFDGNVQFNTTDLEKNTASLLGGALFNQDGGMTVNSRSTLKDNHAGKGGGGIYNSAGALYVTGSTLSYNTTGGDGGGIVSVGGSVSILDCHLENNSAGGVGGGIFDHFSKVAVSESFLELNHAPAGGGIYNATGEVTVTDSKLGYNFVSFFGGGIATFEGKVQVTGSDFTYNSALAGASIFNSFGTVQVGTTFFHPTPPDNIDGPWIDLGGNKFL
jgi:hypothetical protein